MDVSGSGGAGFAGNLLLGGFVGMGVDAATGAAMDHKPNPIAIGAKPSSADIGAGVGSCVDVAASMSGQSGKAASKLQVRFGNSLGRCVLYPVTST